MKNKDKLNGLKSSFYKGPTEIVKADLDSSALLVYFFLTTCSADYNPSVRVISRQVKLNKDTVARALTVLQKKNIIQLVKPGTRGHSAEYAFTHPKYWRVKHAKARNKSKSED